MAARGELCPEDAEPSPVWIDGRPHRVCLPCTALLPEDCEVDLGAWVWASLVPGQSMPAGTNCLVVWYDGGLLRGSEHEMSRAMRPARV